MSAPSISAVAPRRHKVVRIIARLNVGGPAQQVCFLHENLGPEFETILITGRLDNGEADMSHLLSDVDRVYWIDSLSRAVRPWSDLEAFWKIYQLLRRERPTIVHTHTAKAGTLGRLAALLAGVPCRLHTYHGHVFRGYFGPVTTRFFLTIERVLSHITTRVIAVSESQRDEIVNQFKVGSLARTVVLRNGFNLEQLLARSSQSVSLRQHWGIPANKTLVTWAGRLVAIKGIDLLAEVIHAAAADPRLHFLIVGDGPEGPRLRQRLSELSNVTICGWVNNMADVWSDCDVALLTSANEGTPTALIEAMAFGKPFVSTDVGGVRDLSTGQLHPFEHGLYSQNGFLIAPDPRAIVGTLQLLAGDPARATEMGYHGRAFVLQNFCSDRLAGDIRKLYLELVSAS